MRVTKFLLSIMAVMLCITGAFAATTDYKLVTPDEDLSLGYAKDQYYKLGELKVTSADGATEAFDTSKKVVVTVYRESAFTNQSVDSRPTLAYDLVISPDMKAIASGDSFDFLAASIDAGQGLEIGTKVTGDFLAAADGFYLDTLTFKASLDNDVVLPSVGDILTFGKYTYNGTTYDLDWRVLSVDIDNKRALLITERIIEKIQYHSPSDPSKSSNAWEESLVRNWLTETFLTDTNFTVKEQARILSVDITHKEEQQTYERTITAWGSGDDKMFLLSSEEASTAPYFGNNNSKRKCTKLLNDSNYSDSWWLRSPGNGGNSAAIVDYQGIVTTDSVSSLYSAVRPAFWMKFD